LDLFTYLGVSYTGQEKNIQANGVAAAEITALEFSLATTKNHYHKCHKN
jgi:hypothetical protein